MTCTPFQFGTMRGVVCEGSYFEVFDGKRTWRWEEHHYYGDPWLVDRRGRPLKRQPGARSKFWSVYEAHQKERTT